MARSHLRTSICVLLLVTIAALFRCSHGARVLDGSFPGAKIVEVRSSFNDVALSATSTTSSTPIHAEESTGVDNSAPRAEKFRNGKLSRDDYAALLLNYLPKGNRRNSTPSKKHN